MSQFGVIFSFPAPGASDVAQRELTVTVNGQDPPQVKTFPGTATQSDEFTFNDEDSVVLTLVDIDAHNNRSQPSAAFTYAVVDDVAPPQPGQVGVAAKRQL